MDMGSLPDSKYIIQTDGYWFVEAHDVDSSKGYISVSAKGIVNGLSNQPNDGCDFGPDSYNPNYSGSGFPYTQTSGIQEAINYVFTQNGGTIKLLDGIFDITNAPFITVNSQSIPAQINLPLNDVTQPTVNISMIGSGNIGGGWAEVVSSSSFKGGPVIRSLNAGGGGTGTSQNRMFYCPENPNGFQNLNNIALYIDGVHFQTSPTADLTAVDLFYVGRPRIGSIYIDTNSDTLTPTSINTGQGLCVHLSATGVLSNAEYIYVSGYSIGLLTSASHLHIGKYVSQYNLIGIQLWSGTVVTYSGYIGIYTVQDTSYFIYNPAQGQFSLKIGIIDMGDQQSSGTPFNYTAVYYETGNATTYLEATLYSDQNSPTYPITYTLNTNTTSRVNVKQLLPQPSPSLSTNPPVSATAYQNTNLYDILIYLPVYTSTSGTAGNVKASIGASSSSLTQVVNDIVNSGTSSSNPRTIQLKVPAGWYYEFTGTTTTFGTATVVAD